MPIDRSVHVAPDSVSILEALGIPPDVLRQALLSGFAHRQWATPFSPVTEAGFSFWSWTNETLRREMKVSCGWFTEDPKNVPMTVSPDGTLQITALCGNGLTGSTEAYPDAARARGDGSLAGIVDNLQAELFKHVSSMRKSTRATWWLLYHHDEQVEEIRAELSLPLRMRNRRVRQWGPRHILPPIDVRPGSLPQEEPLHEEINVDVRRVDGR